MDQRFVRGFEFSAVVFEPRQRNIPTLPGVPFLLAALFSILLPQCQAHPMQMTTITVRIDEKTTRVDALVHLAQLAGANPATGIPALLRLRLDGVLFQPNGLSRLH